MDINQDPEIFLFLSRILGKKVIGSGGEILGKVYDLAAEFIDPFPVVTGIIFSSAQKENPVFLPWKDVIDFDGDVSVSIHSTSELLPLNLRQGELLLKDALLDKQVVDTDGAKIRRVNDLQFIRTNQGMRLVHVDVGFRGLIRRMGLIKPFDIIFQGLFDYKLPNQFISWKFVQPLHTPDLLRLNITQNRLGKIHPADLADILEEMDAKRRAAVFQALDVETAAETLEETDPKVQVSLINDLNSEKASDIIEEMSLSDAADLIADLPKAKAEGILKEMEKDIAEDVKELLTHPETEAGGLMTTSYLSFRPSTTVKETLEKFRQEAEDIEMVYYVYVTDDEEHLLGVVTLRDLILADQDKKLEELMDERVISVKLDDNEDTIAEHFAKYGVTAIPVVDEDERMHGTIIFKNLLEVVAPQLEK